jgi:hypothetical protein
VVDAGVVVVGAGVVVVVCAGVVVAGAGVVVAVHTVVEEEYLPGSQSMHGADPISGLILPAAHAVHEPPFGPV